MKACQDTQEPQTPAANERRTPIAQILAHASSLKSQGSIMSEVVRVVNEDVETAMKEQMGVPKKLYFRDQYGSFRKTTFALQQEDDHLDLIIESKVIESHQCIILTLKGVEVASLME